MDPVYEYKMIGGMFSITVYPNRIHITDKSGGAKALVFPSETDILVKHITGATIKGFMRKLELTMNDGTRREIPNIYGKDAEKLRNVILDQL